MKRLYPIVIKFTGKHTDDYYVVNSPKEYTQLMINFFIRRDEEGWYHYPEPEPKQNLLPIPDGMTDNDLLAEIKKLNKKITNFNDAQITAACMKDIYDKAVEGNTDMILHIMEERRDYEYEDFEEIELLTIDNV